MKSFFSSPKWLLLFSLFTVALFAVGFGADPVMTGGTVLAVMLIAAAPARSKSHVALPMLMLLMLCAPMLTHAAGVIASLRSGGPLATIATLAGVGAVFTIDNLKESAKEYFAELRNSARDRIFGTSDGVFFWQEAFAKTHLWEFRKRNPKEQPLEYFTILRSDVMPENAEPDSPADTPAIQNKDSGKVPDGNLPAGDQAGTPAIPEKPLPDETPGKSPAGAPPANNGQAVVPEDKKAVKEKNA